jgi:hypothetical protein
MTAVIAILNKSGLVMAADSAVTVNGFNSKKIYNTANKIFTLSKFHPVGIMIYSSSNFMTTPWETIIKLYRKKIGSNAFDSLNDYKNDFIKFLRDNNFFTSLDSQKFYNESFIYSQLNIFKNDTVDSLDENIDDDQLEIEFNIVLKEKIEIIIETYSETDEKLEDFKTYCLTDFESYINDSFDKVSDLVFNYPKINDENKQLIIKLLYLFYRSTNFISQETGLVFGGFGDKEIYPSVISLKVSEVVDNKLRYKDDLSDNISDLNNGSILPYAQTDVMNMFIKGIDPVFENTFVDIFRKFVTDYNESIKNMAFPISTDLAENIDKFDINALVLQFQNEIQKYKRENQINPTVNTVSILSKEDLAEMAESLIYLTYMKRRISSNEESVGGPIDVAIISKGDGFIWKKRKHYFDENLNKHFMHNYFNV